MIKRLLFTCTFLMFVIAVTSQTIAKWKIEDVVRSYSGKNDTNYVINFWATFCKPCIEEIPDFLRIVEKYKKQKVKLLLVSLDLPSFYPAKIAAFAKKNNYKTNIVWLNETDADIFCPMIAPKWSGAIPATIIVNNKTGYRKFTEDQISPVDFEKYLNEAINGNAANKYLAPMNDAEVIKYDGSRETAYREVDYVTFKSNDSSVYAISGGKVSMVAKIEGMKVIIVEKDKLFYTYSNLGSTLIKKGEEVKANQLIGYAAFDMDKFKPTVELYISTGEEYMVLTKDDFIKR
jgi:thiol-disulfide isomerase/thioredoxin